jgi:hypothetical protein
MFKQRTNILYFNLEGFCENLPNLYVDDTVMMGGGGGRGGFYISLQFSVSV